MEFLEVFFIVINLLLYGASAYIYIQFLLFMKVNYLARFTSGKLTLTETASVAFGLVVMTGSVIYGPAMLGKAIGQGWENFMVEMTVVTDGIVNDIADLVGGENPVYVRTEDSAPPRFTDEQRQATGPAFTVPQGQPQTSVPGVGGGIPGSGDEHAGGGIGYIDPMPTPIFSQPEMPPLPTPTLAPTATPTPFAPEEWNPSMPPPTPHVYPRNP